MDSTISLKIKNNIPPTPNRRKTLISSIHYNPHKPTQWLRIARPMPTTPPLQVSNSIAKSRPPKSCFEFLTSICKTFFYNVIDPPLPPSVDPSHVFTGNFASVNELCPTECPVIEGKLPISLKGVYIRNGPNPQHMPMPDCTPLHFVEGDGMLHSIQLSQGRAIYACCHVKTYKFKLEREAGFPIFPNMLSGCYGLAGTFRCFSSVFRVLIGHINLMKGFGTANTSLACFGEKLVALCESDLPYILDLKREGDIETVGRWDFDNKLFANMTAHPKSDMDTKETFAFKCSPIFPYLTLFRFDENGVKQKDVPIFSMHQPTFIHDFAITKRFAIFPETQLLVAPENVFLGRGMPVVCNPSKVPRIGILARYAKSDAEMRWIEVEGFNAMHVINAWENGDDEVVVIAPNAKSLENILKRLDEAHYSLEKVTINLKTEEVSRNVLSTRNLELGSINGSYLGKKNRYAYLGVVEEIPKMSGVVKMDLEMECEVSRRFYGAGWYGGEPVFVARNAKQSDIEENEDDGFVVTYIHNENSGESKFIVMDATSPYLQIVAAVKLPTRVP